MDTDVETACEVDVAGPPLEIGVAGPDETGTEPAEELAGALADNEEVGPDETDEFEVVELVSTRGVSGGELVQPAKTSPAASRPVNTAAWVGRARKENSC